MVYTFRVDYALESFCSFSVLRYKIGDPRNNIGNRRSCTQDRRSWVEIKSNSVTHRSFNLDRQVYIKATTKMVIKLSDPPNMKI